MAETSRLLFPSLRFCILNPFFQLNIGANLLQIGAAVARSLATPVAGLLENADRGEPQRRGDAEFRQNEQNFCEAELACPIGAKDISPAVAPKAFGATLGLRPT
jgi:hypothetical protein